MAQKTLAGVTFDVTEEGYMTDRSHWTRDVAAEIAKEEGVALLTDRHWQILAFLQKFVDENGALPTIRRITSAGGFATKEFYELFPGGPLKKAAKIAGLSKPASCI
jgi:dissimilatory sulfite reductase related protein